MWNPGAGGGKRIEDWLCHQFCAHRSEMNGAAKFHVVGNIANRGSMVKAFSQTVCFPIRAQNSLRISLTAVFCGRGVHRRDECLKLAWKNRELMRQIFFLFTKVQEHFEQSLGIGIPQENRPTSAMLAM